MYVWKYVWIKSIDLEVSKSLHKCSASYIIDMFRISASIYNTRGGIKSLQPKVKTTRNGLKIISISGS